MSTEQRSRHIASIGKAFNALSAVADSPTPVTAKSLSQAMSVPLPTTYHLLSTLVAEGALVRGDGQAYLLGPRIAALADAYHDQLEPLARTEGPLHSLAERTGESVYLSAWRGGDIHVVSTAEGNNAVRVAQLNRGAHGNINARASGKVLLAFARKALREDYLRNMEYSRLTERTISDPDEFNAELDRVREQGYATDIEEFAEDVCCVSAPIMSSGHLLGAFTVSSPSNRYAERSEELLAALKEGCRAAEGIFSER